MVRQVRGLRDLVRIGAMEQVGPDRGYDTQYRVKDVGKLPAPWAGATDPGNAVSVSFSIPTALNRVGGNGPAGPATFTCGNTAGHIFNSTDGRFDPATGLAGFPIGGGGEFSVDLGWAQGGPPSNECTVVIAGRCPGVYAGVITATVAVVN